MTVGLTSIYYSSYSIFFFISILQRNEFYLLPKEVDIIFLFICRYPIQKLINTYFCFMNLKKIFLINLVVFLSVFSYSQNTVLLNWISTDEHGTKVETFENSTYLQEYNGLPVYQLINKLNS